MLIKRFYEIDPLACPKCGGEMKVVAFIEPPQGAVIERILRPCGLWQPASPRPPPIHTDWSVAAGFSDAGPAAEHFADGDFPGITSDDFFADGDFPGITSDDFAQAAPDDSAYFADIDACEAAF